AWGEVWVRCGKGERIASVGPTGAGKTTLLAMLTGFFEPQSGRILFDGQDVADYSLKSLRRQVSLVTQETIIFAATARENIAYGDERLMRQMVLQARHPNRRDPGIPGMERDRQAGGGAHARA